MAQESPPGYAARCLAALKRAVNQACSCFTGRGTEQTEEHLVPSNGARSDVRTVADVQARAGEVRKVALQAVGPLLDRGEELAKCEAAAPRLAEAAQGFRKRGFKLKREKKRDLRKVQVGVAVGGGVLTAGAVTAGAAVAAQNDLLPSPADILQQGDDSGNAGAGAAAPAADATSTPTSAAPAEVASATGLAAAAQGADAVDAAPATARAPSYVDDGDDGHMDAAHVEVLEAFGSTDIGLQASGAAAATAPTADVGPTAALGQPAAADGGMELGMPPPSSHDHLSLLHAPAGAADGFSPGLDLGSGLYDALGAPLLNVGDGGVSFGDPHLDGQTHYDDAVAHQDVMDLHQGLYSSAVFAS